MAKMCQKASNRMKNLCHKLFRKLINKFDLLAFEKLEPSKMVQSKKVGKWHRDSILKSCWGQIFFFTTYKVKETGKWCELVNPYNTSKRCSDCGKVNKDLKDEETFLCLSCGYKEDRDVNAAKNILWKAQVKLGLNGLGTSSSERI